MLSWFPGWRSDQSAVFFIADAIKNDSAVLFFYPYWLADSNNFHFHIFILFLIFGIPTATKRLMKDLPSRESTKHALRICILYVFNPQHKALGNMVTTVTGGGVWAEPPTFSVMHTRISMELFTDFKKCFRLKDSIHNMNTIGFKMKRFYCLMISVNHTNILDKMWV